MTEKKESKYQLVTVDTSEITEIMEVYAPEKIAQLSPIDKAIAIASGTTALANQMKSDTMVRLLKSLAGNSLGFFQDKQYDKDVYVNCATQALLTGHRLTGYEWGIISGRLYSAKAFFERALAEIPGLIVKPVQHSETVFSKDMKQAVLTSSIEFEFNGKSDSISKRFTVKAGNYASIEQIEGKAERKILCALYKYVTGNNLVDADFDEVRREESRQAYKPQVKPQISSPADELESQFDGAEETTPIPQDPEAE